MQWAARTQQRPLEALGAEPSDVVLLDVLMPEMAGYETQQMSRA
jgi:CheY-like chemotaxis protein